MRKTMRDIQLSVRWKVAALFMILAMLSFTGFSQITISGKVSENNSPGVPGISVSIKGTKYGAGTNNEGSYKLIASIKPGSYTIVFSGIGFKTEEVALTVTDAASYTVNAQMKTQASKLDEVIVTGTSAGTTRRQLGSYISTVKADDLTKGATGNVLAALQGKTAGAQISQNSGDPAGGMSVRLRGISSVSSSSEPLYIIDGVIVNNSTTRVTNTQGNYDGQNTVGSIGQNRMVDINPQDIERVEVLNGAAAAAIYGSRANAGVVQIFTKKGKSGAPKITFSTSIMQSSLRKKLEMNNAPTKFAGPTDGLGALTQDIITTGRKTLSPGVFLDTLSTIITPVSRYDYQDYIFRKALGTDNTISISGGSDNTKYYVSGSYFYNQGVVKNTDFQRYSFRSNIDQTINKWASVSLGLNYINSTASEKPDGNSFYSPMNSVTILGNFHNIQERDALGNIKAVGERGRINPVSVIEDIQQKQTTNRVIASFGAKLKPVKNLSIDYTMGIDNYAQNGTTYIPPYAYNANIGFFGGGVGLDPTQNGYASAANNNFFAINHDLNATYNLAISRDVQSVTQVGFSQQYEKNRYLLNQSRGFAPFIQTVSGGATVIPGADERSEISIAGIFVQQNFKYRNHVFVTGALRRDGSSVFGPDQRNQLYAKASASYVISGTEYWEKLGVSKWWDVAKLRVAYGESGNLTGIGAFERFNVYTSSPFISRSTLNGSTRLAEENIKPERQQELEFGADLSFLSNRIGLTINVYNKKVKDLLINRQVAPTSGFSSFQGNVGKLENKGFEIVLTGMPVRKKDFSWEITGVFNRNRNKVLNTGQKLILFATNGGAPVAIIEGQPLGVFYGTFFATKDGGSYSKTDVGVPNSNGLVLNAAGIPRLELGTQNSTLQYTPGRDANGQPTGAQLRKVIGDPNPDFTASLVNEFSYKKLSLRIQIDAVRGNEVFNADFRTRQGVGNGKVAEMEHRGELPRGYISPAYGIYLIEEWRIDNGSFVKLRELSLNYSFGKLKCFSDLSLNFSGRNLISWDNYNGYDPEVNAGGQSTLLRGIDFGAVPIPKTFSFGIQAKF
jgi:TonB-linked SusC/RagA family outer membrane protein